MHIYNWTKLIIESIMIPRRDMFMIISALPDVLLVHFVTTYLSSREEHSGGREGDRLGHSAEDCCGHGEGRGTPTRQRHGAWEH